MNSAKIDEIFKTMNGHGEHACYCPRSLDNGCECAIKTEYAEKSKQALLSFAANERTSAVVELTGMLSIQGVPLNQEQLNIVSAELERLLAQQGNQKV